LPYHRFKLAQNVTLLAPDIPSCPFVVVRLLPPVGDEPQYHIDSRIDGHRRTVIESQIRPVDNAKVQKPAPVHLWLLEGDDVGVDG
jgi:hypothetical protein